MVALNTRDRYDGEWKPGLYGRVWEYIVRRGSLLMDFGHF